MIQLRSDCLVFETAAGECIPCSAEELTIELIGSGAKAVTPELIHNAAAALLHYFKNDLGREKVSIVEFTSELVNVLRRLGFEVLESAAINENSGNIVELDLCGLAGTAEEGMEILFFTRLRAEIRRTCGEQLSRVRFVGLRPCVKKLSGARRWNGRCQALRDQIVDYLRHCLSVDVQSSRCELIIR